MNEMDLSGRTAIVTGGAKGIGYSTAERMLKSGARLCLWDLDKDRLKQAELSLSSLGEVQSIALDVTDESAVAAAMEETLAANPAVDIMVCNAGIAGIIKNTWDYSLDEWNRLQRVDLTSVFLTCRAVVPPMLARGYGRIIILASIAGMEGAVKNAPYSAAKAGAIGFTKALGKELAQSGILVNAVTPAAIDTEMLGDVTKEYIDYMMTRMPMGRLGRPEEAAALIAWLASEECSFSTGAVFDLSGGRGVY